MQESRFRRIMRSKPIQLFAISLLVFIITTIVRPGWLNAPNIRLLLNMSVITGIFVCGFSPLLMSGALDFAGTSIGVICSLFFGMMLNAGIPWPIAVILALAIGGLFGLMNAFFVVKLNLMAFIATMAVGTVLMGVGSWITNNIQIMITADGFNRLSLIWVANIIPFWFIFLGVVTAAYTIMLMKTRFGRSVVMCGGNQAAARLAGLNPKKIRTILFINSGAVSALAGLVWSSQNRMAVPGMGGMAANMPHFQAFIASILGGVSFFGGSGSLVGAFSVRF